MQTRTLPEHLEALKRLGHTRTQSYLSAQAGVTQATVSRWLNSERRISIDVNDDGDVVEVYERKPLGKFAG